MRSTIKTAFTRIIGPFLVCITIFLFFYFGGDSYQTFGLAAVDSTRKALKYVLGVTAFLSLAVLAQRLLRYVVFDGIVAQATGAPVPKLLSQLSGLIIYIVALSACAGIVFEQDLTVLWAASGVAGLVLGMALRELLQDVFAGIALNIDRAVRIGDYIQLHKAGDATISGQLLEISWRTTRIKDFMGDVVVLPNSKFSSSTITNFSQPAPVSFRTVTVTLDARIPPLRAVRILQAAALDALTKLIGPATSSPWVEVKGVKLEGVEYMIAYKAEWKYLADAKPLVLQAVLTHLAHAGLEPARLDNAFDPPAESLRLPDSARLGGLIGAAGLFHGVPADGISLLAEGATLRAEPADRIVAQAGEAGGVLHLVLEGLLTADAGRRTGSRPMLPPMLRPGDLFDATVALLGEAYASTVRTRTPALLCEIDHDLLQRLFQMCPEAFLIIGETLAVQYGGGEGRENELADDLVLQMRHLFPETASTAARSTRLPMAG